MNMTKSHLVFMLCRDPKEETAFSNRREERFQSNPQWTVWKPSGHSVATGVVRQRQTSRPTQTQPPWSAERCRYEHQSWDGGWWLIRIRVSINISQDKICTKTVSDTCRNIHKPNQLSVNLSSVVSVCHCCVCLRTPCVAVLSERCCPSLSHFHLIILNVNQMKTAPRARQKWLI